MESREGAPKPDSANLASKYASEADEDGFLNISSFVGTELNRQVKNVAGLLDGEEGTSDPESNLGRGLRHKGKSGNYCDMQIHKDDLDEFVSRVRAHFGEDKK